MKRTLKQKKVQKKVQKMEKLLMMMEFLKIL